LPKPALDAIEEALQAWGLSLCQMGAADSLWPSSKSADKGLSSGAFYSNLQRHLCRAGLQPAGVHVLRHSAAKLRREVGQCIEEVSQFLDHSSLAVTTTYLRRLEGEKDRHWHSVATTLGLSSERDD
jgi:site-specific recombinase XerD